MNRQQFLQRFFLQPARHSVLLQMEKSKAAAVLLVMREHQGELQLLLTLLDNYGVAVSRERLFREQLTREYDGTDRTMDGRASRLRRKLQNVDERWNVQVVWGQGYRISYAEATEPQP